MKTKDDSEWVKLYEFEDYMINPLGHIKSKDREGIDSSGRKYKFNSKPIKPRDNGVNPLQFVEVTYYEDEKKRKKTIYVHRAVADHFKEKPTEEQKYIIHIDNDQSNNEVSNLKWATKEELAKIHYKAKVKSTRRSWVTRRKLYGKSGLKPKEE